MILSYCLNPDCSLPQNPSNLKICQNCGGDLILHGRYRAVKKIGKGGFGATFLSIDLSLPGNPLCVVKQLRPSANDPDAFEMALDLFEREAKTLGKLDHPQIPRLLDYFEQDKRFYLVQNWVKGKTLQQEVKKDGIFSETKVKKFLLEVLEILKYIHSLKIIHRDIKPANIIRREQDGRLVLIDFGAVKDQVNSHLAKTYGQTALTEFAVGTMGFAPPEQLAMRPFYASDIYALGATCLYLMSAKSPKDFPIDELTGELAWQREIKVSKSFEKVLSRMLEMNLRDRYKSADEVIKDLDIMPYAKELEEGMLNAQGKDKKEIEEKDNTSQNTHLSATSRLAMAIRARKSRQGKSKYITQVNPRTVLNAYLNGRRDFNGQNFNQFNFAQGEIPDINFRNCQLIRVNFEEANLEGANFYCANLAGARFFKANLTGVYFFKADLQSADLRNANLKSANLEGANLEGTNLCGANLTDANITEEQIQQSQTNWATIFPDGKRHIW
ncbi:serine/threonine-protein kinase [Cyanobacterium aponinum AL20118]|uniref:Serine/threonine-protein kinase B n=1 Tax=Cyanobacterium aponinum AL20115 TaxID=3090662 RepID=A0AAF1C6I5_9CHRO|nr:serine/threonine-protein kinase [Cyanobacterium aponinum]WPF89094.1 serine/threonine-protein kinase [Cyanobacterium aponinum AL20115]